MSLYNCTQKSQAFTRDYKNDEILVGILDANIMSHMFLLLIQLARAFFRGWVCRALPIEVEDLHEN